MNAIFNVAKQEVDIWWTTGHDIIKAWLTSLEKEDSWETEGLRSSDAPFWLGHLILSLWPDLNSDFDSNDVENRKLDGMFLLKPPQQPSEAICRWVRLETTHVRWF